MNLKMMMIRNVTNSIDFQDKEIEIIVMNIGNDVITNDQFVCLIESGLTTDSGYFEYKNFIDAIGDSFNVQNQVCNIPSNTKHNTKPNTKPNNHQDHKSTTNTKST